MLCVWLAGLDRTVEVSCLVVTVCLLSAGMICHHAWPATVNFHLKCLVLKALVNKQS